MLDEIEETCRLLDASARLGTHMHQDLPRIDRWEEVLAQERPKTEGKNHDRDKADDDSLWVAEGEQKERAVAAANNREHMLEAHLEPLQRIA